MGKYRYFLIYKPFGMLSQFTATEGKRGLGELFPFPKDVYPLGRLDEDSEGLLLLTNDPKQNARLLGEAVEKEYWVQVEGQPSLQDLFPLTIGVELKHKKTRYKTLPAQLRIFSEAPEVPPRNPPIRYRANIPDTWLSVTISEGKNRQVRKMTAHVGFPTLRLVRWRIDKWDISGMQPGDVKELLSFS